MLNNETVWLKARDAPNILVDEQPGRLKRTCKKTKKNIYNKNKYRQNATVEVMAGGLVALRWTGLAL